MFIIIIILLDLTINIRSTAMKKVFSEVCRYKNIEFDRRSLLDAHFDASCINKMAANTQMTSDNVVTSLTSCQG